MPNSESAKTSPSGAHLELMTLDPPTCHRSPHPSAPLSLDTVHGSPAYTHGPNATNNNPQPHHPAPLACMPPPTLMLEPGQRYNLNKLPSCEPVPCPAIPAQLPSPAKNSNPPAHTSTYMTQDMPAHPTATSYRDALLSPPPLHAHSPRLATSIKPACSTHLHSPSQRSLTSPFSKRRCFRCLAIDHQVYQCRDPIRCARCWCSGHKASRCKATRLMPFFAALP